MPALTWIVIVVCLAHSGMFSGLNLAMLGISRLRLEVEAAEENRAAERVLKIRRDTHFLLTTILWGNVAFNTLLAIMANSVLAGAVAFVFSTFVITFIGEILPQAYFSRHALTMASRLSPIVRFYQFVLYPVARPTAMLLDWWLGKEGIQYFREEQLREVIMKHIEAEEADVDRLEGLGALNFLALDDIPVSDEGEPVDPESVIALTFAKNRPVFPSFGRSPDDPFLQQVNRSGHKWVVITDDERRPRLLLDADGFLRSALFGSGPCDPISFCHRPIVVLDSQTALGDTIHKLSVKPENPEDDVVDNDTILVWSQKKRIITGADILGRLLRGIVLKQDADE